MKLKTISYVLTLTIVGVSTVMILNKVLVYFGLQGTSAEQDNRFSNKDKKLMKEMKFAESLAKKVREQSVFYG